MIYPSKRLTHFPMQARDHGRYVIRCSCGQSFTGDTKHEAATAWDDHRVEGPDR